jgi:hypothetical protein
MGVAGSEPARAGRTGFEPVVSSLKERRLHRLPNAPVEECREGESNPHGPSSPIGFEPTSDANFATPADSAESGTRTRGLSTGRSSALPIELYPQTIGATGLEPVHASFGDWCPSHWATPLRNLVRKAGVEPARPKPYASRTYVSASSTTSAESHERRAGESNSQAPLAGRGGVPGRCRASTACPP